MRKGLKVARGLQLLGAVLCTVGVARCSMGMLDGSGATGGALALGFLLIVGGKAYEFMRRE